MEVVPVVDLARFAAGTAADRREIAEQVDRAGRSSGFLQVVGHGIESGVVERLRAASDAFFALPLETKRRFVPAHARLNRGYAALESEALAYSLGVEQAAADRFEAFNVGPDAVPDDAWHRAAPHDFFAPNLWPDGVSGFREAVTDYFSRAAGVALTLTDVFAAALGLPDRWFRPYVDRSTLTMRLLNYERRPDDPPVRPNQQRMGAHTDYGVVTVLCADATAGLEIQTLQGNWRDVTPAPGALIVNLGDLTAQWTNDRWRSTLHRVVLPAAGVEGPAKRRSAALFLDANYDARVECLPTCTDAKNPPRYPPVLAGEHLIAKLMGPRVGAPSKATTTTAGRLPTRA